jgi:hypothetical protein
MVALRHEDDRRSTAGRRRRHLRIVRPQVLPLVRRDTLPEHTDYRDTGCELSPSCLGCSTDRCKHDDPPRPRRASLAARDREIALLRHRHAMPISMLADAYGVTPRTIFRILSEQQAAQNKQQAANSKGRCSAEIREQKAEARRRTVN